MKPIFWSLLFTCAVLLNSIELGTAQVKQKRKTLESIYRNSEEVHENEYTILQRIYTQENNPERNTVPNRNLTRITHPESTSETNVPPADTTVINNPPENDLSSQRNENNNRGRNRPAMLYYGSKKRYPNLPDEFYGNYRNPR